MERKAAYFEKLIGLLDQYNRIMVVNVDNVCSKQLAETRQDLRGLATVLMGKNTLVKRCLAQKYGPKHPLNALVPFLTGNVGLVFTDGDLKTVVDKIRGNKRQAAAKAGSISPVDVTIPKGPTGLEPTQTSFLQALNIASKIAKGAIEILNDVQILAVGQKVGQSEAALLAKLDINPFWYGLEVLHIYDDGMIMKPDVLYISDADMEAKFRAGVQNVAALSLGSGVPTMASLPFSIGGAYRNLLAIVAATDYTYPQAEDFKNFLDNPDAFAAAAPVEEEKKEDEEDADEEEEDESDEESDGSMGFGLFD